MLSNKEIVCPVNLLNVAHKKKGVKAGIVNAGKPLPMLSVHDAVNENLIEPIFIGKCYKKEPTAPVYANKPSARSFAKARSVIHKISNIQWLKLLTKP